MPVKMQELQKFEHFIDTCGKCGDCASAGTQATTAKRHVDKPCPVKTVLGFEAFSARGRILVLKNILSGKLKVTKDILDWAYSCTTCGSCKETCLAVDGGIDTPSMMEALRHDLVENGITMDKHKDIVASILKNNNPYGEPATKRMDFFKGKNYTKHADTLLFLGCTASFREPQIALNAVALLEKLGIPYALLDDEGCCGSILKRCGYVKEFDANTKRNIDAFRASGAKTIVFTCAGCYRTFKKDFTLPSDVNVRFLHITEFLDEYLKTHPSQFKFKRHARISYHDPCHLGRHAGVYEAPRSLLKNIGNATFIELDTSRNYSHCCGSGGGVKSSNPDLAKQIAASRNAEAASKQVEILISACPFCEKNLRDGLDGLASKLRVADISEILLETSPETLKSHIGACGPSGVEPSIGAKYMEYLAKYPEIFSDLVQGSIMDFTIYNTITDMENKCEPVEAFNVSRSEIGISMNIGRADNADLELALSVKAVEKLTRCPTKSEYAQQFGKFYNEPDEIEGWIDFVLNKRTKTLIKMGYGKFAETAGILEDEDQV
nr:(Fe-S)-binding protein [Candidatus Sigynarchaeota archaeon]